MQITKLEKRGIYMVRPSFIKSLCIDGKNKMTVKDWLIEIFLYNRPMIFLRQFGRFLKRLPKWFKLCWKTESWDYEGIYDFIEMQLKEMKKAQEKDTWHLQTEVKRSIKQIDLVLLHLDMYRNSHKYFELPETKTVPSGELHNGEPTYRMEFVDEEYGEERFKEFLRLEQKHFDKFWSLLKKWHTNWWT